jgi:hypothetical protein
MRPATAPAKIVANESADNLPLSQRIPRTSPPPETAGKLAAAEELLQAGRQGDRSLVHGIIDVIGGVADSLGSGTLHLPRP